MRNSDTFQMEFQPIGKRVKVAHGVSILEAARQSGIDLASACGGEGNCGQCQVVLFEGQVNAITPDEEFILTELEIKNNNRLACCVQALSDLKIHIPKASLITGQRLQIEADLHQIEVDPAIRAIPVDMTKPTLHDVRSDLTRIAETLGLEGIQASPEVIRTLPAILRENDWRVNVYLRDHEIVGLGKIDARPLGFAVDLGTTKIAAYLVDLESGTDLASGGIPNPRIGYGEDVISRLGHAHRNPSGGQVLAEKVQQALNELLGNLLKQAKAQRSQVVEAYIVGNTAMTHLLIRLPINQLITSAYVAAASSALDIRGTELGLEMAPGAYVHVPPCIGGFVGADHVAMILASDLDKADKIALGVDIGTNTEIAIRKPGLPFLTSASCASGPAFEGAHISDAMRAASGAIEKVRITAESVELTTINDEPAVGLFPQLPNAQYRQIGNAAVVGAKWMLISKAARQRAQEITKNTRYNELTTYPKFNRQFALGMLFPNEVAQGNI